MIFSKRTDWKLTPNEISLSLSELKKQGKEIIDLTESNPTLSKFKYPQEPILKGLASKDHLLYDPAPRGIDSARAAVSAYYQENGLYVDPQQIFLTSSTSEAYSFLFRLLTNPGDHIAVGRPSYPLFDFLAQINDVEVDPYSLVFKNGQWAIDVKQLEEKIGEKTRAIVLVSPNNPTGSFVKKNELQDIFKICQERNIALICDEVFSDYRLRGDSSLQANFVNNTQILTFSLSGISKVLGLPQMKLGWIVASGPKEDVAIAAERLEVILDTFLSVNTPAQNALKAWLSIKPQIQKEILIRIKANEAFLRKSLEGHSSCRYLPPEGGWYAVLRLPNNKTEEDWVVEFLQKDCVFVHPGYFFDFEDEPYIVLSLLPEEEKFRQGITRILSRIAGEKS
ncbi:MAG: pyridoxal phosphate-dependent aminotransferase [Candidatus Omnitrophota bacterium]